MPLGKLAPKAPVKPNAAQLIVSSQFGGQAGFSGDGSTIQPPAVIKIGATPSIAIGGGATAAGAGSIAIGAGAPAAGAGSTLRLATAFAGDPTLASNCIAIGVGAKAGAQAFQNLGYSGSNSIAIGVGATTSGTSGIALGTNASISGNSSNAISIGNAAVNTTTSGIAIGVTANSAGGIAIGNAANSAGGIAIGGSTTSAGNSVVIDATGTGTNLSNAQRAIAINVAAGSAATWPVAGFGTVGIGAAALPEGPGQFCFGNGSFASTPLGTAIAGFYILRMSTTTATVTEFGLADAFGQLSSATPTGKIALSDNSTYIFDADIVARKSSTGTDYSAWNLKFCINREAGAATTALVGTVTKTLIGQTAGAATWDVNVTADTTNGRPNISVTGQAGTTIRWVANCRMTKVSG